MKNNLKPNNDLKLQWVNILFIPIINESIKKEKDCSLYQYRLQSLNSIAFNQ